MSLLLNFIMEICYIIFILYTNKLQFAGGDYENNTYTWIKSAIKDIINTLLYWGVPYIKTYVISIQAMNWAQVPEKRKIQIQSDTYRIARIFSKEQKTRVGIKTKLLFNMMRIMQKAGWGSSPVEKEYWKNNGWLAKERPWNR